LTLFFEISPPAIDAALDGPLSSHFILSASPAYSEPLCQCQPWTCLPMAAQRPRVCHILLPTYPLIFPGPQDQATMQLPLSLTIPCQMPPAPLSRSHGRWPFLRSPPLRWPA
jgi:hypothetical protein